MGMLRGVGKIGCFLHLFCFLLFGTGLLYAKEIKIVNKATGSVIGQVQIVQAGRYDYVSIAALADVLSLSYRIHEKAKQITLTAGNTAITFSAINPFIQIGDQLSQIPLNILYRNGHYYAPLEFLVETIRPWLTFNVSYDAGLEQLFVVHSTANIVRADLRDLANGSIIRITLTESLNKSNIFTSESNGWFYVDFYGGRIEPVHDFIHNDSKIIKSVRPIQLSDETARLSFQIRRSIMDKNVQVDGNHVVITLRTRDSLSPDLLEELEREREKWKIDVIIIDPGHGGKDPGAIGRSGLYEKDAVFSVAKYLKRELESRLPSVKVLMTRSGDKFVPLKKRTAFANQNGGKLFLSIHADANPARWLKGHTVYFLGPAKTDEARKVAQFENSVIKFEDSQEHYEGMSDLSFILGANAQNAYNKESQDLASLIDREITHVCNSRGHGVRQAQFFVLYGASMPNILVETAFLSNLNDERNLKNDRYLSNLAKALANGIVKFKQRHEAAE